MVLEPTRFPGERRRWIVVVSHGDVHILPAEDGHPAVGHLAARACPACRPILVREGPLDEPIWTHDEPGWPGAEIRRQPS